MKKEFWKLYLATLLPFLALDAIWLGLVAPGFYRAQIGFLMADRPNLVAAGIFYLLYVAGMAVFVTGPGVREASLLPCALKGGLFGLVAYATYDLTNLATVAGWPLLVTAVDLVWGTVLSAATATAAVWLARRWIQR